MKFTRCNSSQMPDVLQMVQQAQLVYICIFISTICISCSVAILMQKEDQLVALCIQKRCISEHFYFHAVAEADIKPIFVPELISGRV